MIDDKEIERVIEDYVRYSSVEDEYPGTEGDAFKAGARWAINKFLKDLWHSIEEEPKKNRIVLTDTQSIIDKGRICWLTVKLTENGFVRNWSNYAKVTKITRWLYIDDLLPKKGGKE